MAKLTAGERKALPNSDFAASGRKFPIEDKNHARNALARVSQFGDPKEKREVRQRVRARFPSIAHPVGKTAHGD